MNENVLTCLISVIISIIATFLFSEYFIIIIDKFKKRISWKEFIKTLTKPDFISEIKNFSPDILIGLNDGIIPASIIARNLEIDNVYYMKIENIGAKNEKIIFNNEISMSDKKILLIDDQLLSGSHMNCACKHLESLDDYNNSIFKRTVIFLYDSPNIKFAFDIQPPGRTKGKIKLESWSFSDYHKLRGRARNYKK